MIDKYNKERLKRIAKKLYKIEIDIENNVCSMKDGMQQMSDLTKPLDFEELCWIDNYIYKTYDVDS